MSILAGIDGTGPQWDSNYTPAFAHSFVRLICRAGKPNTLYRRGPGTASNSWIEQWNGNDLEGSINAVTAFCLEMHRRLPQEPIIMVGYSRGAAGIVSVAQRLQRASVRVRALMMFDCVDRDWRTDSMTIPNNVSIVKHVMRSPASGSRESFGNSGLQWSSPTHYIEPVERFRCTHGGMGGCWWHPSPGHQTRGGVRGRQTMQSFVDEGIPDGLTNVTFERDRWGSIQVWDHCREYLVAQGYVTRPEASTIRATLMAAP